MNIFEEHLIALAESMAETLIMHLVAKIEAKLGIIVPVPVNPPMEQ